MHLSLRRAAASPRLRVLCARSTRHFIVALLASTLFATAADAVIVRGRVTTPLGAAVPNARVQLIASGKVVAVAYAGADGTFEIRTGEGGRFTLLTYSVGLLPAIGDDFYGGAQDIVAQDVVIAMNTIRQEVSVTATGIPTPLPQLTAPLSVIPGDDLSKRFDITQEMRQAPGVVMVQTGQAGGATSLFVRGGNSTANLVLIDGIPADDVGGSFDFGTVSSTGIGRIETYRGPDSALYGTDAGAAVIAINTPRGISLKPLFTYSGDAGNLHTWRNEGTIGGTAKKLDYFGAFSRFDTSNALAFDRYHSATSAVNVGYNFSGNTQVRFTIRNADSATGLPGAHDFYGISNTAKQSDQDLYSGITLENRTQSSWHNLLRYGIARKREQQKQFGNLGTPIELFPGFTEYFGNVVTIRGANGYSATGQASFLTGSDDMASNRDQLYYQSDWSPSVHFNGLFGFRYDNERGSFNNSTENEKTQRTNFEYSLQFQGQYFNRLTYSLGGAVEKNHLYGIAGTPRLGLGYTAVQPRAGWFHGTRLRANAATGVQEPSLALDYFSIYEQLLREGDTANIAAYHIGPSAAERSRTYDIGVDQDIFGQKLILKAGYFHNVFDRQIEGIYGSAFMQYFNINIPGIDYNFYEANTLAYRAQGLESELDYQLTSHLMLRAGYTFLQSRVIASFASDAIAAKQGFATENPNLPGIPIGAEGPLIGARPFRRPPHSGFFSSTWTRARFALDVKGALASRSDDSTFLDGYTPSFDNSLILPNRNLDFGYLKLDIGGTYAVRHNIAAFAQLENLLNNQHIGPIGYPGLPFTFRTGLKFRFGGD
jgi:vitamin B12 transporter